MAKLQIFAEMGEFNYLGDVIDGASLTATVQTDTSFTLTDANGAQITFTGTGLTYDGTAPLAGTVSSVAFFNAGGDKIAEYTEGKYKFSLLAGQDLTDIHSIADFLNSGNDTVTGSAVGDDIFAGNNSGNDTIDAAGGDDFVKAWSGNNRYDGGDGSDVLTYQETFYSPEGIKKGIVLDVAKGTVKNGWGGTDHFENFEQYRGSHLSDTLIGSKAENERFAGLGGADKIDGGKGNNDRVVYDKDIQFGGDDGIIVNMLKNKIVDGFGKTDKVTNIEQVVGTKFADSFGGDNKDNMFRGLDGVDSYDGKKGHDVLSFYGDNDKAANVDLSLATGQIIDDGYGNTENAKSIESLEGSGFGDTLALGAAKGGYAYGDDGDDTLVGGEGLWQYLEGAAGNDKFVFRTATAIGLDETGGIDVIGDFTQGEDTIDLSAIAAFSFIGTTAFSKTAGELRFEQQDGNTFVYGDVDGDGNADFKLNVQGTHTLTAADFGL